MSTTPKLDRAIATTKHHGITAFAQIGNALEEIRECLQAPKDTRYPSEIETRLIELCGDIILALHKLGYGDLADEYGTDLAAIKRDLGLSP